MGKTIVITVGKSIFDSEKKNAGDSLRRWSRNPERGDWHSNLTRNLEGNSAQQEIIHAICRLEYQWNSLSMQDDYKNLPAELSSLARFIKSKGDIQSGDKIYLLYSETNAGVISNLLLEKFLTEKGYNVCSQIIKGLSKDEDSFRKVGLRSLINGIAEICRDAKGEVYIIATGGYKPESIYASLTGMLHKKRAYYLHEGFYNIIELPVLPISLGFNLWRDNAAKIEMVIDRPVSEAKPSYDSLHETIRELIAPENGIYKWEAVGDMLYKAYKNTSDISSLQARGLSLLSYFDDSKLREKYHRYLKEFGDVLWIGDKVPEMVDHSIRHHQNLFEIAENFLCPLLEANENFMNSSEIYVLLCVILLHDCGHSLSSFPSASEHNLLPTQIREWHNILGYERLNPCYEHLPQQDNPSQNASLLDQLTSLWKGDNTSPTQCDREAFWKQELEVIATIGLYHRRKMPLACCEHSEDLPSGRKTFYPLKSLDLRFHDQLFTDSALKIAALFRIIDNCDTQLSRAGTPNERKLRYEAAESDIRAEEKREKDAWKILSGVLSLAQVSGDIEKNLSCEIARQRDFHSKDEHGQLTEEQKNEMKCEIKKLQECISNEVKAMSCDKRDLVKGSVDLVREVCSRRDFKEDQRSHFEKHAKVEKVIITPAFTDDKYKFVVRIRGKKCYEDDMKEIKKNMKREYDAAKPVLDCHKIKIEYQVDPY